MRRGLIFLLSFATFAGFLAPAIAVDEADYSSPYLPVVQSAVITTQQYLPAPEGGVSEIRLRGSVSLQVRVHRNSVKGIKLYWYNFEHVSSVFERPCVNSVSVSDPWSSDLAVKLVSRVADGDWFIERLEATFDSGRTASPSSRYCAGRFLLSSMTLRDSAVRELELNRKYFARTATLLGTPSYTQYSTFWRDWPTGTPGRPCKLFADPIYGIERPEELELCNQKLDWDSYSFTIGAVPTAGVPLPKVIDYPAELAAAESKLTALAVANSSLQEKLESQTAVTNSLQGRVKVLETDKAGLEAALADARESLAYATQQAKPTQAALAQLRLKLARICGARPKPRGC